MDAIAPEWMQTDAVTGHARQFLVDIVASATGGWTRHAKGRPAGTVDRPVQARVPPEASKETRTFLAYVLLDLATVDPELDDEPLVECLAVAREAGIEQAFEGVARKELAIQARAWESIKRRAAERRRDEAAAEAEVVVIPTDAPVPGPDETEATEDPSATADRPTEGEAPSGDHGTATARPETGADAPTPSADGRHTREVGPS